MFLFLWSDSIAKQFFFKDLKCTCTILRDCTHSEEVFMKQPEGFVEKGKENLVCRLKQSIYGLKQSPRCWNTALDDYLKKMNSFRQNEIPVSMCPPMENL